MTEGPPLELEAFAKIDARVRAGRQRARVLAEANVPTATWLRARVYWLGRMAAEVGSGDDALHKSYVETLARLVREGADLEPLEPLVAPEPEPQAPPVKPSVGGPHVQAPASMAQPQHDVPPLSSTAPVVNVATTAPMPPSFDPSSTMGGPSPWAPKQEAAQALPFGGREAAAPPSSSQQKVAEAARPALPFGGAPHAAPPPSQRPAAAVPFGSQTVVPLSSPAGGKALPFDGAQTVKRASPVPKHGEVSPLPFQGGENAPEIREASEEAKRPRKATGTAAIPAMDLAALEAMRAEMREVMAKKEKAEAAQSAAAKVEAPKATPNLAATVGVGDISAEVLAARAAMPFGNAKPAAAPSQPAAATKLTLAQFASLSVELERAAGDRAGTCARYGLDEASYVAEQQAWSARIDADAAQRDQFNTMRRDYAAWLDSQR